MTRIAFRDVNKKFGDVIAVRDFNLEVEDGEFLVLLGPSGCGKSTALRLVAGLEEPTSGEIIIGDEIVNDVEAKNRDIAMVFQSYALYPHMTVEDNLAFSLKLHRMPKREINERVQNAAKVLEIEQFLKRKPRALSGGQRQRVAMGRAIVREPDAFLMDEPLSNLDAKLRVQMRAEIHQLQRRLDVTTIYVTHDQVEAMTMGDRVAVMNKGILQQVDAPQRLYDYPANLFVAGFIGTPPMNLLEGAVSVDGGVGVTLAGKRFDVPEAALKAYPSLRTYAGRNVVVGIRSRGLHPASERPDLPVLEATVELVEALGAGSIAYFRIDARELASEVVGAEEAAPDEGNGRARPNLVAEFPAHAVLRLGDRVPVAVDAAQMHFFDEASGAPLR